MTICLSNLSVCIFFECVTSFILLRNINEIIKTKFVPFLFPRYGMDSVSTLSYVIRIVCPCFSRTAKFNFFYVISEIICIGTKFVTLILLVNFPFLFSRLAVFKTVFCGLLEIINCLKVLLNLSKLFRRILLKTISW